MSKAPLGTFEEHVLLAVLRINDAYGMRVRRELEQLTNRDVAIGAVYATLDRLEAKDFVVSTRTKIEGRSRRLFAVRPAGIRALEDTRRTRRRLWEGVDLRTDRPKASRRLQKRRLKEGKVLTPGPA